MVVENRIGAGGNIGVEAVFRSPADGYTPLLASTANPINVALYPKLPFDLFKDFAPIAHWPRPRRWRWLVSAFDALTKYRIGRYRSADVDAEFSRPAYPSDGAPGICRP